jgi:hypothetical protein
MKKNIKIILYFSMLFMAAGTAIAKDPCTGGIDPHDSLLFDGGTFQSIEKAAFSPECYWKVVKIKGMATGKVIKREIFSVCGEKDTITTEVEQELKENDILVEGSIIDTWSNSMVAVAVYLQGESNRLGEFFLTSSPSSRMQIFELNEICFALKVKREQEKKERVTIIKGKVTIDAEPDAKVKVGTVGKRASAEHTKTRYSHEVKIDGIDTIDVIRVYKGSVEVTHMRTDFSEEEAQANEMERLSQEMQEGKITMEEYSAKLTEYVTNAQTTMKDIMKPVTVDEGSKCIVTGETIKVEPLGAGDEDNGWQE